MSNKVAFTDAAGSGSTIALSIAQGEYESCQVFVRGPASGVTIVLPEIPGVQVTAYLEHYHATNSGVFPDALVPPVAADVARNQNQGWWLDFYAERGAAPGVREATVRVQQAGWQGTIATFSVAVDVLDFELPMRPSLRSSVILWPDDTQYHGAGRYNQAAMRILLDHRVQPTYADPTTMDPRQETANAGFWAHNGCSVSKPKPSAADVQAVVDRYPADVDLGALVADEPSSSCTTLGAAMRAYAENITANPRVKTFVTTSPDRTDWAWTERVAALPFQWDRSGLDGFSIGDREGWAYNCLQQGGSGYPFWIIGKGAMPYRVWAWILKSQKLTGWHYWRADWWNPDPAQWDDVTRTWEEHPGEGILLYGLPDGTLVPSMRLKWLRDTTEDYDLLAMMDPAEAAALVEQVARSWTDWAHDSATVYAARSLAQEALIAPPPPPPPPPSGAMVTLTTPEGILQWVLEAGQHLGLELDVLAR